MPVLARAHAFLDIGTPPNRKTAAKQTYAAKQLAQPLYPKLAQRRLLPGFIHEATSSLGSVEITRLAKAWGLRAGTTHVITVGTLCSGSELYMLSLKPLAEVLTALTGCTMSFRHAWACELNPRKRALIRDNFSVGYLFSDLKDIANSGGGKDELSGNIVHVPSVDIVISGFSCKDASRLNSHHQERLDFVEKGSFTTGSTFAAFIRLVCFEQFPIPLLLRLLTC